MIVIAGGTGRLGRLLVGHLGAEHRVRVLSRTPEGAASLQHPRVEVVQGDVRDPANLHRACRGARVVVSAVHGFTGTRGNSPATVDRDGNRHLVDAAGAHGAHVVLMSIVGASRDSPMELLRMKHAAERYLVDSGVPATVVRATAFGELWAEILRTTAGRSGRPIVFGAGRQPIDFVSVADVAALLHRVVLDPATRGQTLEIGGPEQLTMNELAAAVQAADGRTAPARHIPVGALWLAAQTIGRIRPALGRQMRAAIAMDRVALPAADLAGRRQFSDLPCTVANQFVR
jgi:NADH dehydrogenase